MKKDYQLIKLKNTLQKLRMQISRKGFGTEIKRNDRVKETRHDGMGGYTEEGWERAVKVKSYKITIKTTESTGHFSKRTISGSLDINSAFLSLGVWEQERKLLKTLNKNLNLQE